MPTKYLITSLLLLAFILPAQKISAEVTQAINPLIGDLSFYDTFGYAPDAGTDEQLRISTHLAYVENMLRKKNTSHLSPAMQKKRMHLLDLLHAYILAGNFPKNYDHPGERLPCFIDKNNNICAVGYLVEQTAGHAVAEQINNKHQYERITDMHDAALNVWVATSGLTLEECAMIQPAYNYASDVDAANGIATATLSGINLSASVISLMQYNKGTSNYAISVIGAVGGTSQLLLGIITFPYGDSFSSYEYEEKISMLNIGVGTATLFLNGWCLTENAKNRNKLTDWNIYNYQSPDNSMGMGISFSKRF